MRDYQTKQNKSALPDTINNERLGAGEFNSIAVELEGAVTSSDQSLAPADGTGEVTDQLSKAMAIYGAGGGAFYADSGAADAYVLTQISPKKAIPAYFDGMIILFSPGNTNTGASTVNVASLGVKDLELAGGVALTAGDLVAGTNVLARYNLSGDRFELIISGFVRLPQVVAGSAYQNIQVNAGETGFELIGPLMGFKNILINGNMDYFQRATGSVTGYLADRWYCQYTDAISRQASTVTGASYCLRFGNSVATFPQVTQRIESNIMKHLIGKTVTFSFWARSISGDARLQAAVYYPNAVDNWAGQTNFGTSSNYWTNGAPVTSWAKYYYTFVVDANCVNGMGITLLRGDFDATTTEMTQAQLEVGPAATPFEVRNPAFELELCQRYYQKSYDTGTTPGAVVQNGRQDFYLSGLTSAAYSAGIFTNFPTTMRTVPTVTVYSPVTGASGVVAMTGGDRAPTLIVAGEAAFDVAAAEPVASGPHSINYHYTADAEL